MAEPVKLVVKLRKKSVYQRLARFAGARGRRRKIYLRIVEGSEVNGDGCWVWQGADSGTGRGGGYGRMSLDGRTVSVHRTMFQIVHGPVPGTRQIDHTCRNRRCCNPDHLELVTPKENARRRDAA